MPIIATATLARSGENLSGVIGYFVTVCLCAVVVARGTHTFDRGGRFPLLTSQLGRERGHAGA